MIFTKLCSVLDVDRTYSTLTVFHVLQLEGAAESPAQWQKQLFFVLRYQLALSIKCDARDRPEYKQRKT